jgi:predicted nucleotidyltransferase
MRTSRPIDALFPSTRQAILAATLLHPDRWWYQSDLAKHLAVSPSSLQRELTKLTRAGILRQRPDGNRVYFQADPDCPFLPELQGLLTKTAGLVDVVRDALAPLDKGIDCAFVHGSIARGEELASSDVDLLVVGKVGLAELSPALRPAEERLGRPVNPTVYTRAEFAKKVKAGHHFLQSVLEKEKIFIVGDEHDLEQAARGETSRHRADDQAGA